MCVSVHSYAQKETNLTIDEERLSLNYIPASHANLSKLLWKFGKYSLSNESALNAYLHAINCPIYNQYFQDDFIWQNIIEGVRNELDYYTSQFPTRIEVVSYVQVGRYNFDAKAFEILPGFELSNNGAVMFPFPNNLTSECGLNRFSTFFPREMRFIPDNKFSISQIPVLPREANDLIETVEKYRYNNTHHKRNFAVRMRININDVSVEDMTQISSIATFRGQLDEISFFEEPTLKTVVWQKSFKDL
jgi:hypothetical protein